MQIEEYASDGSILHLCSSWCSGTMGKAGSKVLREASVDGIQAQVRAPHTLRAEQSPACAHTNTNTNTLREHVGVKIVAKGTSCCRRYATRISRSLLSHCHCLHFPTSEAHERALDIPLASCDRAE